MKPIIDSFVCPYCESKDFIRRGWRQKKLEKVQLYLCSACHKTFSSASTKGRHYPLETMFDTISLYNLGYSLEESCKIINSRPSAEVASSLCERSHAEIGISTLSNWLSEFQDHLAYLRMRPFAIKKYSPQNTVETCTLAHRQLYRYRFHRPKCYLMIEEEYKHRRFKPLAEFLELVPSECPHQYYQEGLRASEAPLTFSLKQMIVRSKQNYATKLADFIVRGAKSRQGRHEILQKFMLYNDSVTVATEVPVYITRDDILHMKSQLGFEIYQKNGTVDDRKWRIGVEDRKLKIENSENPSSILNPLPLSSTIDHLSSGDLPNLITGHIDILQIRNGQIHILDYKPNAAKERPIEQLTLYAMALSRLTGLRLFEFKCAWFDEKDYFEFYPLHVLHKPKKGSRRRNVATIEGIYQINKNEKKIENLRPKI